MMCSTHKSEIVIPNLPVPACTVHIVPASQSQSHSLLSIGQVCDAGCVVDFNANNACIRHNDIVVLQGHHMPTTQLWHADVPDAPLDSANAAELVAPVAQANAVVPIAPIAQANAVVVRSATATELVSFAHASLLSPSLSTLANALNKGCLPNFPGLSSRTLRDYPPRQPL